MKTDFILFPCFLMRKARLWTALSLLAFAAISSLADASLPGNVPLYFPFI